MNGVEAGDIFFVHEQAVQCQTESNIIKFSMVVVQFFLFPEKIEMTHSAFTILRNINFKDCTESWGEQWSGQIKRVVKKEMEGHF